VNQVGRLPIAVVGLAQYGHVTVPAAGARGPVAPEIARSRAVLVYPLGLGWRGRVPGADVTCPEQMNHLFDYTLDPNSGDERERRRPGRTVHGADFEIGRTPVEPGERPRNGRRIDS
jgi:hypothetical protein